MSAEESPGSPNGEASGPPRSLLTASQPEQERQETRAAYEAHAQRARAAALGLPHFLEALAGSLLSVQPTHREEIPVLFAAAGLILALQWEREYEHKAFLW